MEIERLLLQNSPPVETLCCVLEQEKPLLSASSTLKDKISSEVTGKNVDLDVKHQAKQEMGI